jgi:ribosomal protein S7
MSDIIKSDSSTLDELGVSDVSVVSDVINSSGDPTEEQVSKACSNIVVNDITIPVDVPGSSDKPNIPEPATDQITRTTGTTGTTVEIKYDNVDITNDKKDTPEDDKLKKFMTNMTPSEEVNVVKSDVLATTVTPIEPNQTQKSSFSFDNLYPNMNNTKSVNDPIVKPLQIIEETKSINDPIQEPKSPRKEMVAVKNEDDIDETSSLANFFDDVKKIVEEKGIKIETNNDKMFTLFEDANEVEKI